MVTVWEKGRRRVEEGEGRRGGKKGRRECEKKRGRGGGRGGMEGGETLVSMRVSRDVRGEPNFSSNKTGLHWLARSVMAWVCDDFSIFFFKKGHI